MRTVFTENHQLSKLRESGSLLCALVQEIKTQTDFTKDFRSMASSDLTTPWQRSLITPCFRQQRVADILRLAQGYDLGSTEPGGKKQGSDILISFHSLQQRVVEPFYKRKKKCQEDRQKAGSSLSRSS